MQPTLRLLARSANLSAGSLLKPQPLALLPPIPLYRRLLRAHRKYLHAEERTLGDMYVKAEFKAHQKIDNPIHIVGFLTEWQMYAQQIEGRNWKDAVMDRTKIDKMSDEQIAQMYELMQEIRKSQLEDADAEADANAAAISAADGSKKGE